MSTPEAAPPLRSLLFVPADSERKLAKAQHSGADALVLDLEDAVLPASKPAARLALDAYLERYDGAPELWVRVNDLASGETLADLKHAVSPRVCGIMLPKIRGPEDLVTISTLLDMAEAFRELPLGHTRVLAVCTETPIAVLRMAELASGTYPRLQGLLWGGEDLSAALGAAGPRGADGRWRPVYEQARSMCLMAAHALGVQAIDTVFVDFRDLDACRVNSEQGRADGFSGKIAIHPAQVAVVNEAFTPTAEEVEKAGRIVAAFESGEGAVSLDGQMLDLPHLKAARRVLSTAVREA